MPGDAVFEAEFAVAFDTTDDGGIIARIVNLSRTAISCRTAKEVRYLIDRAIGCS